MNSPGCQTIKVAFTHAIRYKTLVFQESLRLKNNLIKKVLAECLYALSHFHVRVGAQC